MYRMFHIQTHSSSFKMRINLHFLANNYKYTIVEIFPFQLWFFYSYLLMSFSPIRSIFLCPYFFSVCSYKYVIYYIVEMARQLVSLSLLSWLCSFYFHSYFFSDCSFLSLFCPSFLSSFFPSLTLEVPFLTLIKSS